MDIANGQVVADAGRGAQLSREELLELENHLLKISNIKLQGEKLQSDLLKANEMLQAEQQKLRILSDNLRAKYGVDLAKDKLDKDGTFTPSTIPGSR